MAWNALFFLNSILFGIGLAMDAFSVSMANGLHDPGMSSGRVCTIAGAFGLFQVLMPLIGWFCVHTAAALFSAFHRLIPWIALLLLLYIGGKMLREGLRGESDAPSSPVLGWGTLLLQAVATSIDALSVGFTIADDPWVMAFAEAMIIGVVTFGICILGVRIGKRFGTRLAGKASVLGGIILIAIGLEIFLKGILSATPV
ncbi:MAG: manganese efflux pump [Oscillospiraceae bacterium]|nr:manganese efflux pump [Oscillospiraceae bacterium]